MREALLQRALGDLLLEPGDEAFRQDPEAFAGRRELDAPDARSFSRQKERFLLYRELARNNLLAPLENDFPVLQALLGPGAWTEATTAFLAARSLASPFYRDVAPAFVAWLSEGAWGQERWPALLELAHYEYLEVLVTRWPEEAPPEDLQCHPTPAARVVLAPAARILTYASAVHRATVAEPDPEPGTTHLLLHRDADDSFSVIELTEATALLLSRAQATPLAWVAASLGLPFDGPLHDLLEDLRSRGALLGFRA